MKSPTAESSLKVLHAVDCLLACAELQPENITEATNQAIDEVLDTTAQLKRESEFPDRPEIVQFFADRFAREDRDKVVKRIVALVSTLSNEELYASYDEATEVKTP